jgi:hypothetical protein
MVMEDSPNFRDNSRHLSRFYLINSRLMISTNSLNDRLSFFIPNLLNSMSDMDMLSDFTLIVFYNLRKNGERWLYREGAKKYKILRASG